MGVVGRGFVNDFSVYAGYIAFTRDGVDRHATRDPLGAEREPARRGRRARASGTRPTSRCRSATRSARRTTTRQLTSSPVWAVDQIEWERIGGRTAGTTSADEVTLGELALGKGVVRVVGALLPMPTEQYYHPFGLANYAVTYSGYQVLQNALQWERPLPDLAVEASGISFTTVKDQTTITGTVRNLGRGRGERRRRSASRPTAPRSARSRRSRRSRPAAAATASVVWQTKGLKGDYTIAVTADPANAIAESERGEQHRLADRHGEGQQGAERRLPVVHERRSPNSWSSSGSTSYDGNSASAGPGGSLDVRPDPGRCRARATTLARHHRRRHGRRPAALVGRRRARLGAALRCADDGGGRDAGPHRARPAASAAPLSTTSGWERSDDEATHCCCSPSSSPPAASSPARRRITGDPLDPVRNVALPCEAVSTPGPRAAGGEEHRPRRERLRLRRHRHRVPVAQGGRRRVHDYAFVGTMGGGHADLRRHRPGASGRGGPLHRSGLPERRPGERRRARARLRLARRLAARRPPACARRAPARRGRRGQASTSSGSSSTRETATFETQLVDCYLSSLCSAGAHTTTIHPSGNT